VSSAIELAAAMVLNYRALMSYRVVEAAHENAQRHRQLSCHGMAMVKHPPDN
jgi:hypothetical protein